MTDIRLRPRSVSELVDAAFALYRQNSAQYIVAAAIGYGPLLVLQLLFADPAASMTTGSAVGVLLLQLASVLTYALVTGLVSQLGSQYYLGETTDIGAVLRHVIRRVPAIVAASVMRGILYLIGFICLIVGAFYVAARYFAVTTVVVLEDKNAVDAFTRSSELSKGRKRHILNTLILVYVIYFILSTGVTLAAGITGSRILTLIVISVFTITAYPIIGLTEMLLYYDARIRGEGFDLEQITRALDAQPATAT
jgi:hypothetical protein